MKIFLHNKDIVDVTEADTIVLPVDGSAPELEGNVARHFMRHLEIDEMNDLYDRPAEYPFNGGCQWSHIDGLFPETHFKYVCALGVLSHRQGVDHKALLRSALHSMFLEANMTTGKFACPVLSTGWRIKPVDAVYIMLAEAERIRDQGLELHIAELDQERYNMFKNIVG
jgi:hypothetical protein